MPLVEFKRPPHFSAGKLLVLSPEKPMRRGCGGAPGRVAAT